jgi:hypothetical protein
VPATRTNLTDCVATEDAPKQDQPNRPDCIKPEERTHFGVVELNPLASSNSPGIEHLEIVNAQGDRPTAPQLFRMTERTQFGGKRKLPQLFVPHQNGAPEQAERVVWSKANFA